MSHCDCDHDDQRKAAEGAESKVCCCRAAITITTYTAEHAEHAALPD